MGYKSSDMVRFELEPLLQGQTRTAKFKSAYNSLSVLRGTLVCIREEFLRKGPPAPPYPPAPQVCLPIASLLVDGISSNLAHIFSSPGKIC